MVFKLGYRWFLWFCVVVISNQTLSAQSFKSLSTYEKRWVVFHPIAAFKLKKQLPNIMLIYNQVKKEQLLDTFENGGKLDAFRHVFTMASLSQTIKEKKLRKLGIAHEKGNKKQYFQNILEFGERPDSLACLMDLQNNEVGFKIGIQFKNQSPEQLKTIVIDKLQHGEAVYIKRNTLGNYITCDNIEIYMSEYKTQWTIPKCLVKTNK